ncbi:hypothetical protein ABPG77_009713 [Micractinium sp. CCAP 211/92]
MQTAVALRAPAFSTCAHRRAAVQPAGRVCHARRVLVRADKKDKEDPGELGATLSNMPSPPDAPDAEIGEDGLPINKGGKKAPTQGAPANQETSRLPKEERGSEGLDDPDSAYQKDK